MKKVVNISIIVFTVSVMLRFAAYGDWQWAGVSLIALASYLLQRYQEGKV